MEFKIDFFFVWALYRWQCAHDTDNTLFATMQAYHENILRMDHQQPQ